MTPFEKTLMPADLEARIDSPSL